MDWPRPLRHDSKAITIYYLHHITTESVTTESNPLKPVMVHTAIVPLPTVYVLCISSLFCKAIKIEDDRIRSKTPETSMTTTATTWRRSRPVVDVIKLFLRNSGKSGFPPKLKQQ